MKQSRRQFLKAGAAASITGLVAVPALISAQQAPPQNPTPPSIPPIATPDDYEPMPAEFASVQSQLDTLMALLPDGTVPTYQQTQAAYTTIASLKSQVQSICVTEDLAVAGYSTLVSANVSLNDYSGLSIIDDLVEVDYEWTTLTYADLVAEEMDILDEHELYVSTLTPLDGGFDWKKWLAKLLGLLGIGSLLKEIDALLNELGGNLIDNLVQAIRDKNWRHAKNMFIRLFNLLKSNKFLTELGRRIGASQLKNVLSRIFAKMLPIIGWVLFVAELVWAVAQQYAELFSTAESLDPAMA